MIRRFAVAALAVALISPAARAQAPAGWQMRLDRSTNASDPDKTPDVKVIQMGPGFHVTSGPAAVLWSSRNSATGVYTLKGTFHLMQPSGHSNYYGLVFGGADLEGPNQSYLYFLVAQNGTYIVKHRAGDATTHNVQARTVHAAVAKPDSTGKSVNNLEVRVGADRIDYVINGTVVHTAPKTGMSARTDGLWGVRINHQLDVHVEKLGVTK
jgi:opacity protein-like surface antigen